MINVYEEDNLSPEQVPFFYFVFHLNISVCEGQLMKGQVYL